MLHTCVANHLTSNWAGVLEQPSSWEVRSNLTGFYIRLVRLENHHNHTDIIEDNTD